MVAEILTCPEKRGALSADSHLDFWPSAPSCPTAACGLRGADDIGGVRLTETGNRAAAAFMK